MAVGMPVSSPDAMGVDPPLFRGRGTSDDPKRATWESVEDPEPRTGVAIPVVGADADPAGSTYIVGRPVRDWSQQPTGSMEIGRPSDSVFGFPLEGMNLPPRLQSMLEKYRQSAADEGVLFVRPWFEFFHLPPRHRMKETLLTNLQKYKMNYGILTILAMLVTILLNISQFIWLVILIPIWCAFVSKSTDPSWESIQLGSFTLGRGGQWTALASITALLLLLVVGPILFPIAMLCAGAVAFHAVSHPSAVEDAQGLTSAPQVIGNECGP